LRVLVVALRPAKRVAARIDGVDIAGGGIDAPPVMVEKWSGRTPPRYAVTSLYAVTNFRAWLDRL
jgi:hypothetical protein